MHMSTKEPLMQTITLLEFTISTTDKPVSAMISQESTGFSTILGESTGTTLTSATDESTYESSETPASSPSTEDSSTLTPGKLYEWI